ncbi:MAG: hypothetical protein ABSE62_04430 [Chthoniobacteraceae bacterium]|jgi:hypothetical protein
MFIDKIFHLRQPLPEVRRRLRKPRTWSAWQEDPEVHCSLMEWDGMRFEFATRQADRFCTHIEELPGRDPNRILFRSVRGNVALAGMLELIPIRPNLTEVVLSLDCEAPSPMQKVVEAVDRFLNRQLTRLETESTLSAPRTYTCT